MLLPQQRGITEEKHKLRLEFHGQLMKMWKQSLVLKSINPEDLERVVENGKDGRRFDVTRNAEGKVKLYQDTPLRGFMYQRKLQGYRFVPLITETMEAHCHLAITFRRPMKPKSIIYAGGDLDGRLKTLFDALAMPPKSQN